MLKEAYRVLKDGGIMVFDDLIKPQPEIGAEAHKFVYDRLLFDTPFSFDSYQDALKAQGFKILEAHDLSSHLKTVICDWPTGRPDSAAQKQNTMPS